VSPEENKAIVLDYLEEFWNKGNEAKAEEVLAADVLFQDLAEREDLPPGIEGVKQVRREFRAGFPDFRMELQDIIAEGDTVSMRWTVTGTHLGEFNGVPATGRKGIITGMNFVRMKDGRIVEGWQQLDVMSLLEQLGILPKKGMPRPVMRMMVGSIRLRDRLARRRKG
jgi:steroid delta-isomerase-like uncharacterized protein